MFLPKDVAYCIAALNQGGFQAYCVGGCVRDSLLGLTPHDYDLCTDAKPEEICQVFADHQLAIMEPTAATVAGAEPEIAPKNRQVRTGAQGIPAVLFPIK